MNNLVRRQNMGHLELRGSKIVYQNTRVKGYGNHASLVPHNIFCLTGVVLDDFMLVFGDKIGNLVFLCALSTQQDRDDNVLPTGLLCMSADRFTEWVCPTDPNVSISPNPNEFCLCRPSEFIAESKTADQIILLPDAEGFTNALKTFIIYMLKLKRTDPNQIDTLLGILNPVSDIVNVVQPADLSSSKAELSESEKNVLRSSTRQKGKGKTYYGSKPLVPVGHVDVSLQKKPAKRNEPKLPAKPAKRAKQTPIDDAGEPFIPPKVRSRGLTKTQLEQQLEAMREKQLLLEKTEKQPDKPISNTTSMGTYNNSAVQSNYINGGATSAVAQAQIIVNDNSASSRNVYREQETKDFDKTISQAQQIIGIARGYMSDVVQFSGAGRYTIIYSLNNLNFFFAFSHI